jgi:enoyl-CoA hydratase/carnithine racemase
LEPEEIWEYVSNLAKRISQFPAESIEACKRAVYASIDLPIAEALKEEAYQLYQATSKTPAIKRFSIADDGWYQYDLKNQHNWENMLMDIQEIK